MDFTLTEEHRMVQHLVREFAQKEVAPIIKEYDRKQEMAPFVLPRMGACLPTGTERLDSRRYAFVCPADSALSAPGPLSSAVRGACGRAYGPSD